MNTPDQLITTYVGHIMDRIDASGLSPEELEAHRRSLTTELAARIGVVVLEALSSEDRQQYADLFVATEQQDSPEAQQFISQRLPNMAQLINAGAEQFATEYFTALNQ